jgi:hypothetical protein
VTDGSGATGNEPVLLMACGAALKRAAPGLVALVAKHAFVRCDVHPGLELPGVPVLG